jgi:hypothetical protein
MVERFRIETPHAAGAPAAFQLRLACRVEPDRAWWALELRGLDDAAELFGQPLYLPMGEALVIDGDLDAQALQAIERLLRPVPITSADALSEQLRAVLPSLRAKGYPISAHL